MTRRREQEQIDKWEVLMEVTKCKDKEHVVRCLQQATPNQLTGIATLESFETGHANYLPSTYPAGPLPPYVLTF